MRNISSKSSPYGGVASQKFGRAKKFRGGQKFDFIRIGLFCLEKRLSNHKITIFSKNVGGPWLLWPTSGYAYGPVARF